MMSDSLAADLIVIVRLLAAAGAGLALGFQREVSDKPIGMRTLGLISLGAIASLEGIGSSVSTMWTTIAGKLSTAATNVK